MVHSKILSLSIEFHLFDMKENLVKNKSFDFSIRVIKLYKFLAEDKREYVLSKQVLRCGTAIGALIRESEFAESKKDFIHKLSIALKEANETEYWLELLNKASYIDDTAFQSIQIDVKEILKILTAIINTSKQKIKET